MARRFDPAVMCCAHDRKDHQPIGFKPCTVAKCDCVAYWRQPAFPKPIRKKVSAR